jgi:hypothetical protein
MSFFLAALRWFVGKYWIWLLGGGLVLALCVKVWLWRGDYEDAKQIQESLKKVERMGVIRNRPRGADAVVDRLLKGTF